MIKNLKVKQKILSLVVIFAIVMMATTAITFIKLDSVSDRNQELVDKRMAAVNYVDKI